MGFIDYEGTKEDRYEEVLGYAKDQQNEETRRIQFIKIRKWLKTTLGDDKILNYDLDDTIRMIAACYRRFERNKEALLANETADEAEINKTLWSDCCISLLVKRSNPFCMADDKMKAYYTVMLNRVFKLTSFTTYETHKTYIQQNGNYHSYFTECFDLSSKRLYWKWIGIKGRKDEAMLMQFVDDYFRLSISLGLYLFKAFQPLSTEWLEEIDEEYSILKQIKEEYKRHDFTMPSKERLRNPIKENDLNIANTVQEKKQATVGHANESIKESPIDHHKFDYDRFGKLLEARQLEGDVEALGLLREFGLPEKIDEICSKLQARIPVLQETMIRFEDTYKTDIHKFLEYYIPEALKLNVKYIEYISSGAEGNSLAEVEKEVLEASSRLLYAINEKIDEIYKYASMEIQAQAKALDMLIGMDGYVNPNYRVDKS